MNWIIENIEWLFSGIGIAAIQMLIYLLLKNKFKHNKNIEMIAKTGKNSKIYQAEKMINIGNIDNDNEKNSED